MRPLRIGVLQTTTGISPAVSAGQLVESIGEAAAAGVELLFTPEMSGMLDRDRHRMRAAVRSEADDVVLAAVREAAAKHRLWVHLGSLAVLAAESADLPVNRGFVIDDTGAIIARYDKIHLFDVDLPSGERIRESSGYAPGGQAVVTSTPWARLGLSVCYDVRFPPLYNALAGAGAELIAVPAAFTRPTGKAHWHILLRARAIETGSFVVAAAQTGEHEDGRATYGHSLVVDPWGEVLLDMGEAPGLAVLDIDLDAVAAARGRIPALANARSFALPA
ncbi:carbon-nitrogen hydrolase family protein [Glacieibacterium sp.]|uniref:carbon-nitrogen hydrolase family protein n=1 Tax=Glacieibacterium sp. TaxID=2860237 RepID=UPI003AFFAEB3